MNITLERIDELRERANIGYKEAKEALVACNGDMVEALIFVEENYGVSGKKSLKSKREKEQYIEDGKVKVEGAKSWLKRVFSYCNTTRFIVENNIRSLVDIPLTAAIVLCLVFNVAVPVALVIAILTGHKIRFAPKGASEKSVTDMLNKVSSTVSTVSESILSKTEQPKEATNEVKDEIIIE